MFVGSPSERSLTSSSGIGGRQAKRWRESADLRLREAKSWLISSTLYWISARSCSRASVGDGRRSSGGWISTGSETGSLTSAKTLVDEAVSSCTSDADESSVRRLEVRTSGVEV